MEVRPEIRADERAIEEIHRLAFGRDDEAALVSALRLANTFVPELALVAIRGGAVVGHVLFTQVELVADVEHGGTRIVLALAPLAVHPSWQGQGVGRTLVEAGVRRSSVRSEPLVVVLGDPEYFARFGFEPAKEAGIRAPFNVADEALMIRRLPAFGRHGPGPGEIRYPPAFGGDFDRISSESPPKG